MATTNECSVTAGQLNELESPGISKKRIIGLNDLKISDPPIAL